MPGDAEAKRISWARAKPATWTSAKRPPSAHAERPTWAQRVGWLLLIWFLSVLALAVVAGLIRLLMTSAGLTV